MNTPIFRWVNLPVDYQPLASERTVGTFTLRFVGNGVMLLSDDGATDVPIAKGQQFTLDGVDLAGIQGKGVAGDYCVVIGATRTV